MEKAFKEREMWRFEGGRGEPDSDVVADEYPLTLMINGEEFATLVCTPLNLEELVIGFLASEGVIRRVEDINSLSIDQDRGFAYVEMDRMPTAEVKSDKRWISSCCGKSRSFYFQNDAKTAKTVISHVTITPEQCESLMKAFQQSSGLFHETGGVHQASIASVDGLEYGYEDIGRHNALDKLYGYVLREKIALKNKIVIFSGRISSEVLLKVSKMGVGLILSKSASTHLALELAEDLNITAIGFVRKDRMNVYTHPHRVVDTYIEENNRDEKGGIPIDGA
ncbi:formate dehydrogenase accessory sulfurtransferase FdhD [Thalassobacillus hwangdonensis]|uniref:Sulfur carrier protein FdhD n=1 Tax=Thalassobacillus hwangdonensis TaxID=546108 RepID=A0ABW3KWL5_9BACI